MTRTESISTTATPTAPPVMKWLVAVHVLLCLAAALTHLARYPLHHSLFYWWLAPFDLICLFVATPLYLVAVRTAAVLNLLVTAVETIALAYLSVKSLTTPVALDGPAAVAAVSAMMVAARAPLGWAVVGAVDATPTHGRGCRP